MEKLGLTGTDTITGFTGVIVGYCVYLTGCNQLLLSPRADKAGKVEDGRWYDEQRISINAKVKRVVLDNGKTPGFDKPAPVR